MAEGLISRGGAGGSCLFSGMTMDQYNDLIKELVQDGTGLVPSGSNLFTENGIFIAPLNTTYYVLSIGGGGSGGSGTGTNFDPYKPRAYGGGGGSGFINSATFQLNKNDVIDIVIGNGGSSVKSIIYGGWKQASGITGTTGGSTRFGNYLIANGGTGGGGGFASVDGSSTGGPGLGYHNGSSNLGGQGITPPVDLNLGYLGKGGNGGIGDSGSEPGHSGCVYISWGG